VQSRLRGAMDWEHTVSQLAHSRPALVIDRARRLRFVNPEMQDLIGWSTEDLLGRGWMGNCVASRDRTLLHQTVADGLSGTAESGEVTLLTRDGRRLLIRAKLAREITGRARALIVVAEDVREASGPSMPTWDCSCDVSRAAETLGIVQSIRFLDPSRDAAAYVGQPLAALLFELGCTTADVAAALLYPQTSDIVHFVLPDADHAFCVVTGKAVTETQVRLTFRYVDAQVLPAIVEAKVKRVAETSGLSDRERQVLQLLLRGRGLEDIATLLEIAPRTVKFHQANVLQKLGADSRLDLLRVVL
jgi:PAS domain S-box-containing protein